MSISSFESPSPSSDVTGGEEMRSGSTACTMPDIGESKVVDEEASTGAGSGAPEVESILSGVPFAVATDNSLVLFPSFFFYLFFFFFPFALDVSALRFSLRKRTM